MALAPPPNPPAPPPPVPAPVAGSLASTLAGAVVTGSMPGVAAAGATAAGSGLGSMQGYDAALGFGFNDPSGEPAAKRFKGSGKVRTTGDPAEEGEVRFRTMESARSAVQLFDNTTFLGHVLKVALDPTSQDGTKVIVTHMPPGIAWQELKDHFIQVGEVHYTNIGRTSDAAVGHAGSGTVGATHPGFSGGAAPSGKGGYGIAQAGQPCVGEVRYQTSEEANLAIQMFNHQPFKGVALNVKPDLSSWHGTKVLVFNIPVGTEWSELREHFEKAGNIAFCGIDCHGKSKGKGGMSFMQPGFDALQGGVGMGQQQFMGQSQQFPQAQMLGGVGMGMPSGGCAGCGGGHPGQGLPLVGEVRFGSAELAMSAITQLNGTQIYENTIRVVQDGGCKDGSRILVFGLTPETPREALREHFERIGHVEFAGWKGKGKGKGNKMPGQGFPGAFDSQVGIYPGSSAQVPHVVQPPGMSLYAGAGSAGQVDQPLVGEVRFINSLHAGSAITLLNGAQFNGATISVVQDGTCRDGSRVLVFGLSPDTPRQLLQEFF